MDKGEVLLPTDGEWNDPQPMLRLSDYINVTVTLMPPVIQGEVISPAKGRWDDMTAEQVMADLNYMLNHCALIDKAKTIEAGPRRLTDGAPCNTEHAGSDGGTIREFDGGSGISNRPDPEEGGNEL